MQAPRRLSKIFVQISCLVLLIAGNVDKIWAQSSDNFVLQEYGFGSGGSEESGSNNYLLHGIIGETAGEQSASTNFQVLPGLIFAEMANTPDAPTITNDANYYNKLKIILVTGADASDTEYALAISMDNFSSDVQYIQDNQSTGASLGEEDWQYYSDWGGASGFFVLNLAPSTTYYIRAAARQGRYTQSGFGPSNSAATVSPQMAFDIDVAPLDQESNAPYSLTLGELSTSSVTTAADKIWFDMSTNAEAGGTVYIYSNTNGLLSDAVNYTIGATSGNLAALDEGFGVRGDTVAQTNGGPLTRISPYNGSDDNVGPITTAVQTIFDTSGAPIVAARGSIAVKAKANTVTPAALDYQTIIYLIAAGNY